MKRIALPSEHGGWGFLFEPILLSMCVAPSIAGAFYSLAICAGFLMRHPLKLFLRNRDRPAVARRTRVAAMVALAYGSVALLGLALAVRAAGWKPILPFVILSPLSAIFWFYDTRNRARTLLPELVGPLALAATAPSVALAGGWGWASAAALWVLLMARAIPSIFYVRARLRLERSKVVRYSAVFWSHLAFACVVATLVWRAVAPLMALAALGILTGRTIVGLSPWRRLKRPQHIGIIEIVFGVVYIALNVIGFAVDG